MRSRLMSSENGRDPPHTASLHRLGPKTTENETKIRKPKVVPSLGPRHAPARRGGGRDQRLFGGTAAASGRGENGGDERVRARDGSRRERSASSSRRRGAAPSPPHASSSTPTYVRTVHRRPVRLFRHFSERLSRKRSFAVPTPPTKDHDAIANTIMLVAFVDKPK